MSLATVNSSDGTHGNAFRFTSFALRDVKTEVSAAQTQRVGVHLKLSRTPLDTSRHHPTLSELKDNHEHADFLHSRATVP